jgi:hypothetical protein
MTQDQLETLTPGAQVYFAMVHEDEEDVLRKLVISLRLLSVSLRTSASRYVPDGAIQLTVGRYVLTFQVLTPTSGAHARNSLFYIRDAIVDWKRDATFNRLCMTRSHAKMQANELYREAIRLRIEELELRITQLRKEL